MKRFFLCAAALLAIAACESSPEDAAPIEIGGGDVAPAAPQDCFMEDAVTAFTTVDENTLRIEAGADASYEVDGGGAMCGDLRFANQIDLQPDGASICVGNAPASITLLTEQGDQCLLEGVRRIADPAAAPAPVAATQ